MSDVELCSTGNANFLVEDDSKIWKRHILSVFIALSLSQKHFLIESTLYIRV